MSSSLEQDTPYSCPTTSLRPFRLDYANDSDTYDQISQVNQVSFAQRSWISVVDDSSLFLSPLPRIYRRPMRLLATPGLRVMAGSLPAAVKWFLTVVGRISSTTLARVIDHC